MSSTPVTPFFERISAEDGLAEDPQVRTMVRRNLIFLLARTALFSLFSPPPFILVEDCFIRFIDYEDRKTGHPSLVYFSFYL